MTVITQLVVREGPDRSIYPSVVPVKRYVALPERRGSAAMASLSVSVMESSPASQITVDPEVRGGVPCIGSGRWPIAHILDKLASGTTVERVIQEYPGLTLADIQMALETAAWVMRDPAIDWSKLSLPEMVNFRHELEAWQSLNDDASDLSNTL